MTLMTRTFLAVLLAGAAAAAVAQGAEGPPPHNVLQLSASGSVQVQQDQLVLTLATSREGEDAAGVQSQLRQALDDALAEARRDAAQDQLEVRTGDFSIQPRYGKEGRMSGWQGRAELVLSGRDFARITNAAGRIRSMTIGQVAFDLSRQAREQAESQAQTEAIEAFKARASELARGFGFAGYSLREVSVNSHAASPGPRPRMLAMAAKGPGFEADAAVPVEAGKALVEVTVSGSVQLR